MSGLGHTYEKTAQSTNIEGQTIHTREKEREGEGTGRAQRGDHGEARAAWWGSSSWPRAGGGHPCATQG